MEAIDLVKLGTYALCAYLVERFVERIKLTFPVLDKLQVYGCSVTLLLALGISVVVCFGAAYDIFALFSIPFKWSIIGTVAAALVMSGGSSYIHEIRKAAASNTEAMKV